MGYMQAVAQNQLERVLTRRQLQRSLCLPFAEMQAILITWYRLGEIRQIHVDNQMVMARIVQQLSGGHNLHATDPEFHFDWRT